MNSPPPPPRYGLGDPPPLPPRYDIRVSGERTDVEIIDGRRDAEANQAADPFRARQQKQHCCTWLFRCCCCSERRNGKLRSPEERQRRDEARAKARDKAREKFDAGSHLSQSAYIWACGEKAEGQEEDLATSDELIGFLILLFQALSYIVVIRRSDDPPEGKYSITSVTAALYLLVQTASPDLRTGFSLLADGASRRYFVFGACLLVVFGLLIAAAMTTIFSSAENDAAVVANAVTILFVADLDEKVLTFFLTVPQEWRLFWMMNIISISFSLALAGIAYVGNPEAVSDEPFLKELPTWFAFAVNPAAVTFFSFAISRFLGALCAARTNRGESVQNCWLWRVMYQGMSATAKALKREPCFYATLSVWLGVSCASWVVTDIPDYSFVMAVSSYESTVLDEPHVTENRIELVAANLALAAGLVMLGIRSVSGCARQPVSFSAPLPSATLSAERTHAPRGFRDTAGHNERRTRPSRVPSLLVGWGLGYWSASLLYILGCSWHDGGWYGAPLVVSIIAYVALPIIFVIGIFLVADRDILGPDVERVLEPVIDFLKDEHGILHWTVVTVLRDVTMFWIYIMVIIVPELDVI